MILKVFKVFRALGSGIPRLSQIDWVSELKLQKPCPCAAIARKGLSFACKSSAESHIFIEHCACAAKSLLRLRGGGRRGQTTGSSCNGTTLCTSLCR